MENVQPIDAEREPLDTSLVHYDTDTIELRTGCGLAIGSLPTGVRWSVQPTRVTCPQCAATLVNGQLAGNSPAFERLMRDEVHGEALLENLRREGHTEQTLATIARVFAEHDGQAATDWAAMSDDELVDRLRESAAIVDPAPDVPPYADRERIEVGAAGCGCPVTAAVITVGGEVRGDIEGTDQTEHRPGCWDAPAAPAAPEPTDGLQVCGACGERVIALSSRYRCDGCEEESDCAPAPERRTVGLEVLTDALRAVHRVPADSRIAVVLRLDGQPVGVIASDAPEHDGTPPEVLLRLLRAAHDASRSAIEPDLGGELLMPGADVLAALSGKPAGAHTAPLHLRADQVDAGWLVCSWANEGDELLVRAVLECEDGTCPWNTADCCVIAAGDVEPVHFAPWQAVTVRIPAATR